MFTEIVMMFELTFITVVIGYMGAYLGELRDLQKESLKIQGEWIETESLKIQDNNRQ